MHINDLQLFKHLAGSLHFGRTSQACNITPSGLTRTIQRLESELDKPLFYRDNRKVELTPEGEIFRKYTEEALKRWEELHIELTSDDPLRGEISLFCSVTAMMNILPPILERFRGKFPQVAVKIETGDAADALTKLQTGDVDLAIAAIPDSRLSGIVTIDLLSTPLVFIGSCNHKKLYRQTGKEINWQTIPLIVAERGMSRTRLDNWFRKNSIHPNIYAQVAGNEAIIAMVHMGCGIGLIPEFVLQTSPLVNKMEVLTNTPDLGSFSVALCSTKRNQNHPPIHNFLKLAKKSQTENRKQ